jgi:hypothetical protein
MKKRRMDLCVFFSKWLLNGVHVNWIIINFCLCHVFFQIIIKTFFCKIGLVGIIIIIIIISSVITTSSCEIFITTTSIWSKRKWIKIDFIDENKSFTDFGNVDLDYYYYYSCFHVLKNHQLDWLYYYLNNHVFGNEIYALIK